MNITKKIRSINQKTLTYLVLFSIGILLLLWIIQILFLNVFYEKYQENSLINLANELYNTKEYEISEKMENLTFDSNICAAYLDSSNNIIYYNNKLKNCMLGKGVLDKYVYEIKNSNDDLKPIRLLNPVNHSQALLYGVRVGSSRIFLYTPLEDTNSTTSVLRSQLIYVTIIAIIFAIILSMFLSKKLSEPIIGITKKAKKLAEGDYEVQFDSSDISEINELSETLNYMKQEVSKTDAYRRDLMANVSHDLKTPLTMIKAYAEMVRDITYNNKDKREENLNVIIEESDRLNLLVNDILELSKLQTNVNEINLEKFDLVKELNEILKRYEIIKEKEDYKLIVKTPKEVIVKADKKKISQVIYNLINNAINYTGDDKKVFINIIEEKKYYRIEIRDTGKGIDEEDIKYIWNKYYKKDKNHRRNVVGTGLGLSIVKNILEVHNFNYGVESKKNKGTIFFFDIPKIKK